MKSNLKEIIEEYCGAKVKSIKTYDDPLVRSCQALQVKFENGETVHYLIQKFDGKYDIESLEEVEFDTWPPSSSKNNLGKIENMLVSY